MAKRDHPPLPGGAYAYLPARFRSRAAGDPGPRLRDLELVRLMAEDDVDVPLWTKDGLVFDDVEDFITFGASPELAHDVAAWAEDRQRQGRTDESDLAALRLLDRLNLHFDRRFTFVYQP